LTSAITWFVRWVKVPGTELLPGDIVSVGRSSGGEDKSIPADMLLLAGNAIVNEAILTGESTPQWKVFIFFSLLFSCIQYVC
jgi:manganese-transporting P-type ATPase